MEQFFPHEKLCVYAEAVKFAEVTIPLVDSWPSNVAVRDHMTRAIESMVTNLVKAARLQHTDQGTYNLECSLGSVLECAACFDVALRRGLVDRSELQAGKQRLQKVARMEVKLREAWCSSNVMQENAPPYSVEPHQFFLHESLEVYKCSLQVHEVLQTFVSPPERGNRYARRIDELTTSLTLNIAEGNGRFSSLDHRKFVDTAEDSASKLVGYLDLAAAAWEENMDQAKSLLREVMAMLVALGRHLEGKS